MATPEDLLTAVDEVISDGVRRGLLHNDIEDDVLDGRHVTVVGQRLVNFGSCSYLGLETDPRMKAAVREAVDRHGTQFSSSRAYASAPLYRVAESELAELFGRPVIVTPSTSMGHIATMPTLIGSRDVLILDHQAHHSAQTAAKLVQAGGARVELSSAARCETG
jgi:7-keto-8-aminopelargonate synthetase-like enzyme